MGKSKKKNQDTGKDITKQKTKVVIKMSGDCEKCNEKCKKGIEYIKKVANSKPGVAHKGVPCVIKIN